MRRGFLRLAAAACGVAAAHAFAVAPAVSAGDQHSLALHADGTLRAWGDDSFGGLGTGRSLVRLTPGAVPRPENVIAVAAGRSHTVVATQDGRAWAWGYNGEGQLGDGSRTGRSLPVQVTGLDGVVEVAAGIVHTVARRSDGTVWTWGASYFGQLGGSVPDVIRETPGRVPGLSNVIAVAAGGQHTVALTGDGRVWAWGLNESGQLGDGTVAPQAVGNETPRAVVGLEDVVAIATGFQHTLALKRDGTVWAWGDNEGGSLGDGTTVTRGTPRPVPGLSGVVRIAAGFHSAAVRNDGTLWMWGANSYGQLGDDTQTDRLAPVAIGISNVTQVAAGLVHTVAVRADGSVLAWGDNDFGELGDGTATRRLTPVPVPGIAGVARIAGGWRHTVAATNDGRAFTWGDNSSGQLGDGVRIFRTTPAIPAAAAPGGFTAVAANGRYSLALAADGRVWASGSNESGELGDGTRTSRATFAPVSGLTGAVQIAAGYYHGLARKADGTVWAWGPEYMGRLGTGPEFTYPTVPVRIPGLSSVVSIAAGGGHSLALLSDGTVWAWGENFLGQIGDGTTTERYVPVRVQGLANVVEVAAGFDHSLARASDGSVWAWGGNYEGQLGDGTQVAKPTPVRVALPARATAISAGIAGSGAISSDGGVWRWGANYDGQVGVGDIEAQHVPARLASMGDVRAISVGGAHTLALRADGAVFSWGRSDFGQVGDGTLASRNRAVLVARENGAGSVAGNDWFLDLDPATPTTISPDHIPSFLVLASSSADTVTADIRYRAQDVGTTASTFVFALAPVSAVLGAPNGDERIRLKAREAGKSSHVQCALAQLNSQGQLVAVSAESLRAYVSGVLSAQGQSVNVLNTTNPNVAGATFYVGYGANGNAMLVNGTTRSVVSVPGTVSCRPQAPQTGWWYNPAEGGRGFSIEARGNRLFFAAFHYDAAGRATWHFAGGATSLDGSLFTSDFLSASGGQTLTGPYRLPGLSSGGTVTFAFSDANTGTMIWPGGTTPIQRQPFVPNGLTADPHPDQPESGWWWNPAESGRGFFIEWQNGYADLAGYMYDESGNPTWYISVFPTPNPRRFTGTWWAFGGGQSMGGPYRPATRTNDNVGSVDIEFSSPTTATLTLPDGRRVPLVRQAF